MSLSDWPVERCSVYGCWLWHGRTDKDGYGRDDNNRLAHRAVYEAEVGQIPEGLEPDHNCRRRICVFPGHLEPVTRRENERRKQWRYRIKRKACPKGHSLFEYGRRTPEGGIICRRCSGV